MNDMPQVPAPMTADDLVASLRANLSMTLATAIPPGPLALVDFPNHSNVGDSAIWLGEMAWLEAHDRAPIYTAALRSFSVDALRHAAPDGPILIHGGGNFGTSWVRHEALRLDLLRRFPGRPIVQMPQSIHYDDDAAVRTMAGAISAHGAFTLLTRDRQSFDFARQHFDCTVQICPDAALYLGRLQRRSARADVLALLRTDHEQVAATSPVPEGVIATDWLTENRAQRLKMRALARLGALRGGSAQEKRLRRYQTLAKCRVRRGLATLSQGRLVVTDRLHAHILSLLLDIPHIALDNSYGKVSAFARQWTGSYEGFRQAGSCEEAFRMALTPLRTSAN